LEQQESSQRGLVPREGLSDEEVVERVSSGEHALFELLIRRHDQRVYRAIRSLLQDEDEVEDAMQQAWCAAYASLGAFEGGCAFSTWLTRIALNEALARLRRRRRLREVRDENGEGNLVPFAAESPEGQAATRELARMLEEAVDALPDLYRTTFVLREVEGLATAEVADCLGVSEEAVKVRLHRARLALRRALYARAGAAAKEAFSFRGARCDRMVEAVMTSLFGGPGDVA